MAVSIDWGTKVITVNQTDPEVTLVSGTLYELDTDAFRLTLKALEASEEGMAYPNTHIHNTEVTVAGTTFARTIEIINGYSIQFLPNTAWSVRLAGSNNNFFDVENGILVQNQVQVIAQNSAGLANIDQIEDVWVRLFGGVLFVDPATGKEIIRNADDTTYSEAAVYSDDGVTVYNGTKGVARRDEHVKP